ncbi:MAG: ATP-binding protein [Negativicutes bacterium]|nr:ATP-binding protein [Negativicutes bacterium]
MLRQGIARKAYLVVTALVTVLTVIIGYWYVEAQRELLKANVQRDIVLVAAELQQKFDNKTFHDKVTELLALPVNEDEMAVLLNRWLQPILMEVSRHHPDYSMGIYSRQIDRIVAVGPVFSYASLVQIARPESLRVYDTAAPEFGEFEKDAGQQERNVLTIAYPIVYGGRVIGHTWASQKTEDIDSIMKLTIAKMIGAVVGLWLAAMLCLKLLFARLQRVLVRMAQQIRTQDDSREALADLPELLPVFETIIELREDLKQEHLEKNRINREIARLDRLNLIGEMAAGVAHEIRNPMTVIMGFVQKISLKSSGPTRDQLDIVMTELRRVSTMVADFLSLARNKRVEKERCDLNRLIRSVHPFIYEDCVKGAITLELQLADNLPPLFVDEQEIKQLILNLCRNAIEAISGQGRILIATSHYQDHVRLVISDSGSGIAADKLDKVFDPFYTTKAEGTGLGLSICKSIVDRHGGELLVESKEARGTIFSVRLPKMTDADHCAQTG